MRGNEPGNTTSLGAADLSLDIGCAIEVMAPFTISLALILPTTRSDGFGVAPISPGFRSGGLGNRARRCVHVINPRKCQIPSALA
jgi:hypothetical protein